ncbi:MAG: hypothetical protein OXN27_04385 [Candidatus Poribacteria bacterium]|nr:hypothetical protein [Candidatus Poribacteria bacterium]
MSEAGFSGWKIGWGEGGTVHRLNCDFCDSMIDRIIDRIGQPQGLPLQSKFIRKERGLDMPTVSQFCLTCGEENLFDLTESEVDQFLDGLNLPPVEDYSDAIQVPPDDCDFCNMHYYGDPDDEDWT